MSANGMIGTASPMETIKNAKSSGGELTLWTRDIVRCDCLPGCHHHHATKDPKAATLDSTSRDARRTAQRGSERREKVHIERSMPCTDSPVVDTKRRPQTRSSCGHRARGVHI